MLFDIYIQKDSTEFDFGNFHLILYKCWRRRFSIIGLFSIWLIRHFLLHFLLLSPLSILYVVCTLLRVKLPILYSVRQFTRFSRASRCEIWHFTKFTGFLRVYNNGKENYLYEEKQERQKFYFLFFFKFLRFTNILFGHWRFSILWCHIDNRWDFQRIIFVQNWRRLFWSKLIQWCVCGIRNGNNLIIIIFSPEKFFFYIWKT